MPYCQTSFQNVSPDQVESLLGTFSKEYFVGGRAAYPLDDGGFAIDAGENDVRAYYDEEKVSIKFFCRYERDQPIYENKLQSFAEKHNIETISN